VTAPCYVLALTDLFLLFEYAPVRLLLSPSMPPRRRNAPVDVDAEEALGLATAQSENVFLFIPNLIGKSACVLC
jgi:hypothetical protein